MIEQAVITLGIAFYILAVIRASELIEDLDRLPPGFALMEAAVTVSMLVIIICSSLLWLTWKGILGSQIPLCVLKIGE